MAASAHSHFGIRPEVAGRSDIGLRRVQNEDSLLFSLELDLFVVADGMGGTNAGEIASGLTVRSVVDAFRSPDIELHNWPIDDGLAPSARRLVAAVRRANEDVFDASMRVARHRGMGSTVVAAHICRDSQQIHIAHVGDSRCYRLREGSIEQLTRDHSLLSDARALIPHLGATELSRIPRNVISRALGLRRTVKVDVRTEHIRAGDTFLLCTDGLSALMTDAKILETWELAENPQEACDLLVALANEEGGTDNITVVVIRADRESTWVDPCDRFAYAEASADQPAHSGVLNSPCSRPPLRGELRHDSINPPAMFAQPREASRAGCPSCGSIPSWGDVYCGQCGRKL